MSHDVLRRFRIIIVMRPGTLHSCTEKFMCVPVCVSVCFRFLLFPFLSSGHNELELKNQVTVLNKYSLELLLSVSPDS